MELSYLENSAVRLNKSTMNKVGAELRKGMFSNDRIEILSKDQSINED
jgi:hypothetical protein